MFRIFKWSGLVFSLIFLVSFLFSTRRATYWTSHDIKNEIGLYNGMVSFGWRPEGWKIENEKYPSHPGWSGIAEYGNDNTHVTWWFDFSGNKHWEGIGFPLWIPWIVMSIPAGLLWYRDRKHTYQFFQKLAIKICPNKPKKISFRMVVLCSFIHFFTIIFTSRPLNDLCEFFWPSKFNAYDLGDIVRPTMFILGITFPIWGILWSFLYVKYLNKLFYKYKSNCCTTCGYNLTGNVSGICSECGSQIACVSEPRP